MRAPLLLCLLCGHVVACAEPPAAPTAPTLAPVTSPTALRTQLLRGTKPASTAIHNAGVQLVPLDEQTLWTAEVALVEGNNPFTLTAVDAAGRASTELAATIVVDGEAPAAPVLELLPTLTLEDTVNVTGTLVSGDIAFVNGDAVAVAAGATSFTTTLPLIVGDNPVRVSAVDPAGNESAVVAANVTRVVGDVVTADVPSGVSGLALSDGTLAWETSGGDVGITVDEPAVLANGASDVAIAGAYVAWVEGGDLMAVELPGAAELVASDVTSAALTLASDGTPVVAFTTADSVQLSARVEGAWSTPIDCGDELTAGPSDVALTVDAADAATVAWLETATSGVQLAARRTQIADAPLDGVLRVTTTESPAAPAVASLTNGSAGLAWLEAGVGRLLFLDAATFTGAPPAAILDVTAVPGAGNASALALTSDDDHVVIAWIDDGEELLGDAGPGAVVRRGTIAALGGALVLSSAAAAAPAVSTADGVVEVAWLQGDGARIATVELP